MDCKKIMSFYGEMWEIMPELSSFISSPEPKAQR